MVLRVPSSTGFSSGAGASWSKDARIFFGQSPMLDRYGYGHNLCPEQYMVLKLDHSADGDTGSCEIGIHVLADPEARPRVHAPAKDTSMNSSGFVEGESHDRVSVSALPPFKWLRFEELALHPGQDTGFRMFFTDKPEDPNSSFRFELRP